MPRPNPPIIFLATFLAMLVMFWMVSSVSAVTVPQTPAAPPPQSAPVQEKQPEVVYTEPQPTAPPDEPALETPAGPAAEPADGQTGAREVPVVEPNFTNPNPPAPADDLDQFISTVADGQGGVLRGVFAPGLFAYPVTEQPAYDVNWVSTDANEVTLFRAAEQFGVIALLAHNTLAGYVFDGLKNGDTVYLVYGDGSSAPYRITGQESYQALEPSSPVSDFIDLASGQMMTSGDVFDRVYTGAYPLVLQTCIEKDGNTKWGRLFLTAEPE